MFGADLYRGNTTPCQRLREAKDKLDRARIDLMHAEREFNFAVEEMESLDRRKERYSTGQK